MCSSKVVDSFHDRFLRHDRSLTPAVHRVAKFIDQNPATVLASSAADLAATIGTSDATVVRTAQALGFQSLAELRQALVATLERCSSPADDMRRTFAEVGESAERAIDLVVNTHLQAIADLRSSDARTKIAAAVSHLHRAQRIVVFGIGPSAPLAHYVTILLTRNGRHAGTLDASGIALADQLLGLRERDALLALAYGKARREVTATFAEARRLHLPIVLVTDTLERKLTRRVDVVITVKRRQADRVALRGTTLIVLEAIVLGLAASDREQALSALERLNELRGMITGTRVDVEGTIERLQLASLPRS
jgi:DNA-binding MurR/RpiR family transcriptional regulator